MALNTPRIAIVGSGLGGLCLAQGLHRAGVPFEIYEKDPRVDSRTQGYRLRIDADGQRALSSCLSPALEGLFRRTCALTSTRGRFLDPQLREVNGRPSATWQPSVADDDSDGDRSVDRRILREILMCGIADRIHFGMGVRGFELAADGAVRLDFDDSSSSMVFDVVVGADGVNSVIRAQRLPRAMPVDTGALCFFGKTALSIATREQVADELLDGTSVIFADGFAVVIDAMRFGGSAAAMATQECRDWHLSDVEDYLYWAFIGPRGRLGVYPGVNGVDRTVIRCAIEDVTRDWAPELRAPFGLMKEDTLASTIVRSAPVMDAWEPSGVTLLGDAIHVMSPAGGLGANTALVDAAELTRHLVAVSAGRQPVVDAVYAYESDMRLRARGALRRSEEGALRLFARF